MKIKTALLSAALTLTAMSLPALAWASGPCDGINKDAERLAIRLGQTCHQFSVDGVTYHQVCSGPNRLKHQNIVGRMLELLWDEVIAKGKDAAQIGPRRFSVGGAASSGKIIGSTQRLWYASQLGTQAPLQIEVREAEGKSKMFVNLCELTPGKAPVLRQRLVFNDSAAQKKQVGEVQRATLTGLDGKLLIIKFDAPNLTTNNFGYSFTVKP